MPESLCKLNLAKPLIHFWQRSAGAETASQLHLRMTGGTRGLKWQCSADYHLFWYYSDL